MYTLSICTISWPGTHEFSNEEIKNQPLSCICHLLASLDFWFLHWKRPWKPNLYFPLHPSRFHRLLPFLHCFVSSGIPITKLLDTFGLSASSLPVLLYPLWRGGEGYEEATTSACEVQAHYRFLHFFTFTFIALYFPCSIVPNICFCNHYKATGSSF